MKVRNVLVLPAGTEIGLEIFHALKYCKEVRLIGAGQDTLNHATFVFAEYHVVPSIHEEGWVDCLENLCHSLSVDYIFPAYDDVLVALSRERARLSAVVIAPSLEVCEITRSKSATYRHLAGAMRVPALFDSPQDVASYPVLVKPDRGQGSFGIHKVNNTSELQSACASVPGAIICEYLPGREYTVDCFSDRSAGLLFAGVRSRRRIRNGISVNTITESVPQARQMAEAIHAALQLHGAWFFQLKHAENGELTLMEVAPRIAGAMASHRVTGVNFPLLSIFEHERLPISVVPRPGTVEVDRALCNRYRHAIEFDTVYIDLDDTLIFRGKVNAQLIGFVFQCIGRGIPIKLLTRHRGDLAQTLAKYRLAQLFDAVIHIGEDEKKSSYIPEPTAIFVDDSFAERMEVTRLCGIPTFDCSMIEVLTEQAQCLLEMHDE